MSGNLGMSACADSVAERLQARFQPLVLRAMRLMNGSHTFLLRRRNIFWAYETVIAGWLVVMRIFGSDAMLLVGSEARSQK